jgi:hypothetical protein
VLIAVMPVVIAPWSRYEGWGAAQRFALSSGALLTYAWAGFTWVPLQGSVDTVKLIDNVTFAAGAIILLGVAAPKTSRNSQIM